MSKTFLALPVCQNIILTKQNLKLGKREKSSVMKYKEDLDKYCTFTYS